MGLACLQAGLVPGSYVGMGNNGTGCFTRGTDVTMGRSPITGRHTPQSTHRRSSYMAVPTHAAHSVAGGKRYKHPKKRCLSPVQQLFAPCLLSLCLKHAIKAETKALCRQPISPCSSGKDQQGVESHGHACNVWCRDAVWLGDSDDLCTGVSGVCCGCWGALLWQFRPICCWSLPVFYGLCRSAHSLLPLKRLQCCLTTASPFHAKKQVLNQHLHYDLLLSNLALHNSHMQ